MTLQILLAILGSIGGWELIKYILDWIKKRKSTSKIDEAEAIAATTTVSDKAIKILNDTVDFQKNRIDQLEEEVKELRKELNNNINDMSKMRSQIDKVCLRYECANRIRTIDVK